MLIIIKTTTNTYDNYTFMRKMLLLALTSFLLLNVQAQQPKEGGIIDQVLKSINAFNVRENKRDSALKHILGSNSEADYKRRYAFYDSVYKVIKSTDKSALSFSDQVNLELIAYDVKDEVVSGQYRAYLNPMLSESGFHTNYPGMGNQVLATKKEFENYIARLKDIPRSVEEYFVLVRKGLQEGISQPKAIFTGMGFENTYEQHIVSEVEKSIFYKPFLKKPSTITDEEWKTIVADGKAAVQNYAIASYKNIKKFFETEYFPKTRTTIGVSNIPNGLAYYRELVQHYTTTDLSSDEVYEIGLKEVTRINGEMMKVLRDLKFSGTLQEFITYLRNDPKFYAPTPEQLLKEASYIAKQSDGMLPQFFGKLPRQPYGVEPVPAHLAPTYTAGRYSGSPIRSKRAGHYWVNTYDLKSRPLYALESLTLHEAVPGHHLQIALTQELDSLPPFRRNLYVNAFGEGWGLYAEYLGTEMGFYKDPYTRFGRLTYDMWRACRLVIDVGLHTKGWTREQAVKYLADNTALSLHEVNTEINRYISWPGQALAYKMGELKIIELRRKTEAALKDKFDIREFHDLILSQGTVTLKILEQMVDRYIDRKLKI
jgi:uncharacterized protein (DUF885 family)